jgi:hypothetical protein
MDNYSTVRVGKYLSHTYFSGSGIAYSVLNELRVARSEFQNPAKAHKIFLYSEMSRLALRSIQSAYRGSGSFPG